MMGLWKKKMYQLILIIWFPTSFPTPRCAAVIFEAIQNMLRGYCLIIWFVLTPLSIASILKEVLNSMGKVMVQQRQQRLDDFLVIIHRTKNDWSNRTHNSIIMSMMRLDGNMNKFYICVGHFDIDQKISSNVSSFQTLINTIPQQH
jgi:hypothetical protein